MLFDLHQFIADKVIKRQQSLFLPDIQGNKALLDARISGKSALVIGGAGTIGASFVKALLQNGRLERLYVVDINENGLTELVRDIRSSTDLHVPAQLLTYPINFGDPVFEKIFRQKGPFEIVANFAAHKHVRSEKDQFSIEAMIENNVLKAKKLLDLLVEFPPERFFCVSTDKAANPVNVMGASKKLMEDVIMAYSAYIPVATARFANVAFSNGSLPAGFLERLMKKQPLSAPKDVRRYFVSPEESGQLCMLACILGENGDIFYPKLKEEQMGNFTDIAVELLAAFGLTAEECPTEETARQKAAQLTKESSSYPVYFFDSDTSGEKAYEEFFTEAEIRDKSRFLECGVVKNTPVTSKNKMDAIFKRFESLFRQDAVSKDSIVKLLAEFIPNFQHIETGKSLDQKM